MFEKLKIFFKNNKKLVLIFSVLLFLIVFLAIYVYFSSALKFLEDMEFSKGATQDSFYLYENYEIILSDSVLNMIDGYDNRYDSFVVNIVDHSDWVANFVKGFVENDFEYSKEPYPALLGSELHTLDQTHHYWRSNNDFFFYDVITDILFFRFETALALSEISFNSSGEDSVNAALLSISEKFFSDEFEYEINEIRRDGNDYFIGFDRVLGDLPLLSSENLYIIATPDGRLKEGRFLLAEFDRLDTVDLLSSSELSEKINTKEFTKDIDFRLLDSSIYDEFEYFLPSDFAREQAYVEVEKGELYYYYQDKFHELILPKYLFLGEGFVWIEDKKSEASFSIITGANI